MKRKFIFIVVITFLGLFVSQNMTAAPVYVGSSYYGGGYIAREFLDFGDCHPPMRCDPEPFTVFVPWYCPGCWYFGWTIPRNYHGWGKECIALCKEQTFNVFLSGESLYITANNDAELDVYELVSGKCVAGNVRVVGNNKSVLNNIDNNKHYLISLRMPNGIQQQQVFFINGNQLFKGGQ